MKSAVVNSTSRHAIVHSRFPTPHTHDCLERVVETFKKQPQKIDEVLTAFAIATQNVLALSFWTHEAGGAAEDLFDSDCNMLMAMHAPWMQLSVSPEIKNVFDTLDTTSFCLELIELAKSVDWGSSFDGWKTDRLVDLGRSTLILEAKEWLYQCLKRSTNDTIQSLFRESILPQHLHIDPQPKTDPKAMDNMKEDKRLMTESEPGQVGCWATLTRTLRPLLPPANVDWTAADEDNVVAAIKMVLRIAASVDYGLREYRHMEEIQCENSSSLWRLMSWEEYVFESERVHNLYLESPFPPYPLRAREVVAAEVNYLGTWNFIQYIVHFNIAIQFPPEHPFVRRMVHRWIMFAAIHTDVDSTGRVKDILRKHFDLDIIDRVSLTPAPCNFAEATIPGHVWLTRRHRYNDQPSRVALEILNARHRSQYRLVQHGARLHATNRWHGYYILYPGKDNERFLAAPPRFDATDLPRTSDLNLVTHVEPDPEPDAECLICRSDFDDDPCVVTNLCKHTYHMDCLESWLHRLLERGMDKLACCYCTQQIWHENMLYRKPENPEHEASFHLTRAQHEAELRQRQGEEHLWLEICRRRKDKMKFPGGKAKKANTMIT